jgi:hypothetical protein
MRRRHQLYRTMALQLDDHALDRVQLERELFRERLRIALAIDVAEQKTQHRLMLQRLQVRSRLEACDARPRIPRACPSDQLLDERLVLSAEPFELHADPGRHAQVASFLPCEHVHDPRAERGPATTRQQHRDRDLAEQLRRRVGREEHPSDTDISSLTAHGR